jgi:TolA-binding protein
LEKDSSEDFTIRSKTSKKKKEDTTTLKETINQLQGDMEKLESELSVQGDLIKTKDEQITNLLKQLDQNNGSA